MPGGIQLVTLRHRRTPDADHNPAAAEAGRFGSGDFDRWHWCWHHRRSVVIRRCSTWSGHME